MSKYQKPEVEIIDFDMIETLATDDTELPSLDTSAGVDEW